MSISEFIYLAELVGVAVIFIMRMAAVFGDICLPEFIVAGHKLEPREIVEKNQP